ncbi:hypothetical protein GCM10027176_50790 [Actinoallomurus bryophytorum]|uniref:Uncharacterized protein n=1 Tax=Actinoallomurus bryophytorum TaxID=1490222 RepID=A0A543CHU2_9ACTN|nr:hypothetical protein [Actinoallomurus bryophytorum]TQL96669.1 hypothetical protein FB559_2216 [Actinoallomurus bryophytorum]
MVQRDDSGDFAEFMADFLPELEFVKNSMPGLLVKVDELRDFYARHSSRPRRESGHQVVPIPANPHGSWSGEVKSCALFADLVICDDPLSYRANEYLTFRKTNEGDFGENPTTESALRRIGTCIDQIWEVMPLIREGVLVLQEFRTLSAEPRRAVEAGVLEYLRDSIEIHPTSNGYPRTIDPRDQAISGCTTNPPPRRTCFEFARTTMRFMNSVGSSRGRDPLSTPTPIGRSSSRRPANFLPPSSGRTSNVSNRR